MNSSDQEKYDWLYSFASNTVWLSDPAEVLRYAREQIQKAMPVVRFLVFLNDKSRECLVAHSAHNILPEESLEELAIPYENDQVKELLIGRQIVQRKSDLNPLFAGVESELFVPVITPDEVAGCLYFAGNTPAVFTDSEIRLAEMLSYFLLIPMERINWEQRAEQTHEILNTYRERYGSILEAIPYPTAIVDASTDSFDEVNRSFLDWTQYERRNLFRKPFSELCDGGNLLFKEPMRWPPVPITVNFRNDQGTLQAAKAFSTRFPEHNVDKRVIFFITHDQFEQESEIEARVTHFIYTLSHDLKTPIQSLKGFTTLLKEEFAGQMPGGAIQYLDRMFVNLEQMEKLVIDLLEFSRLPRLETNFEDVESSEILKNALDSLASLVKNRPVNIIIDSNLPKIRCNATQIMQVFANLISNALKFTRDVSIPCIEIGCNSSESVHEFYVKDNGMGMSPEVQTRIFDLFYTHDADAKNKSSGIGLTIVKKVIEKHGGKIWVFSRPGEGTIFKFILPNVADKTFHKANQMVEKSP